MIFSLRAYEFIMLSLIISVILVFVAHFIVSFRGHYLEVFKYILMGLLSATALISIVSACLYAILYLFGG